MKRRRYALATLLLLVLAALFLRHALWPPAGEALGGADVRSLFYFWLNTARDAVRSGTLPLWDPHHFAGYPFLHNPQVGFFYPPNWLAFLLPVRVALTWIVLLHLVLAGAGMLAFTRSQGATWTAALLAALTFAFSGFTAARLFAGHLGLLATVAWTPWLLLALAWAVRKGSVPAGLLSGVPFALAILAGHTTSLLYLGLIWLGFAVYLLLSGHKWTLVLRQLALGGVAGLALSAVQTLPLAQFALASGRAANTGYDFASNYSFPPAHLITLLVPDYFGEPLRTGYWSVPVFEELIYYAGILPLLGLALALRRPTRRTWFYVTLMALGLLIAFGSYGFLHRLLYDLLPPFRLARAPGRAAFLFTFAAAALLADAVTRWQQTGDAQTVSRLLRWTLFVGAVVSVAALTATGATFAAQHPTDTSGRLWHQLGGIGWALLLFLAGGGLLWGFLVARPGTRRRVLAAALMLLVVVDLWQFGAKFVRLEPTAPNPLWTDARAIIGDTEQRVVPWGLSIFEQNGAGKVGLDSVFGYNALEVNAVVALANSVPDPRSTAYDVLGAEYVVAPVPLNQFTEGDGALTLVEQRGAAWVYRRARALPLARLVTQFETIPDDAAALARLHQPDFDPATTAILNEAPPCTPDAGATPGTTTVTDHTPGRWQITTDSPAGALLVLSETAFPGWRATVDGEPVAWQTAYTALRAVCVPAGAHVIEWAFTPTIFALGGTITVVALVAVSGALVWLRRNRA